MRALISTLLLTLVAACGDAEAGSTSKPPQLRSTYWSMIGDYSAVSIWVSDVLSIQGHTRRAVSITGHVAGNPQPLLASNRYVELTSSEEVVQKHEHTLVVARPIDGLTWGEVTNRRQIDVQLDGYP